MIWHESHFEYLVLGFVEDFDIRVSGLKKA